MPAAVILSGTHVGDQDPLEALCPRALLPVANRPLISHSLRWLREAGIETAVICANHSTTALYECLGDGARHGLDLFYCEDGTPRGPAGCTRDAADIVRSENYVVVECSVVPSVDLSRVLDAHERSEAAATVVVHPGPGGGMSAARPTSPGGTYIFTRQAVEQISTGGFEDLKEMFIPQLCRAGQLVVTHPAPEPLQQIVDLESYVASQGRMLHAIGEDEPFRRGYRRQGEACVHRTANVAGSAKLLGPVMVGPYARVEGEVVLIGPVVIGADCTIGSRAVVGRSVLWDASRIGRQARIDQCLIAREVEIEAHGARYGRICTATDRLNPARRTA